MTSTIEDFKGEDIIDVRDIIARVEELREERDNYENEELGNLASDEVKVIAWSQENKDESEELETLEKILSDLCGYGGDEQWEGDWYPVTLIKESYFEESMDEMVADWYELPKDLPSFMTITLDYVALKQDYSEVEFDGDTYYYR